MEEVLRRFARLAGLTVEEAEQWQDLCGDAYVLTILTSKKNRKNKEKNRKMLLVLEIWFVLLPLRWHFTNIHYIKMLQVKLILP